MKTRFVTRTPLLVWPAAIGHYDDFVYDDKAMGHRGPWIMLDTLFMIIYIAVPNIAVSEQQAISVGDQYYHGINGITKHYLLPSSNQGSYFYNSRDVSNSMLVYFVSCSGFRYCHWYHHHYYILYYRRFQFCYHCCNCHFHHIYILWSCQEIANPWLITL